MTRINKEETKKLIDHLNSENVHIDCTECNGPMLAQYNFSEIDLFCPECKISPVTIQVRDKKS